VNSPQKPLSELLIHEPTGWYVDPDLGQVYTMHGSWEGKLIGAPNVKGHLRAKRKWRDGSATSYWLKAVVWEAVLGHPLPEGWTLDYIDGDKTNIRFVNLDLVSVSVLRNRKTKRGTDSPNAAFTAEQIHDIRTSAESYSALARRYVTNENRIWRIRKGLIYKDS
jgi:hypothetical protein